MATTTTPTSPTKKRRRRAPATGAAEDCFSCRSLNIKCDRRRPYCGPCLDSNQTCKGYRTQLTWGVGVASRGKLRGMSLPVINAVTEQQRKDRITKQREDKAGVADEKARKMRTAGAGTPGYGGTTPAQRVSPPASGSKLSIITSYDFVNMEPPSATGSSTVSRTSSALSAPQSAISTNSPALSAVSSRGPGLSPHPSHRVGQESYQPPPHHYSSAPSSAPLYEIVTSVSSAPYHSSPSMTVTSSGVSYTTIPAPMHAPAPRVMHNGHVHHSNSQSWNGSNAEVGSLHHQHVPAGHSNLSDLLYDEDMLASTGPGIAFVSDFNSAPGAATTAFSAGHILPPPQFVNLPPSLRFLIDYYDKMVCPALVVFDGYNNPYRRNILPMAFQNPALLEAVFALAQSHLQSCKKIALPANHSDGSYGSPTPISLNSPLTPDTYGNSSSGFSPMHRSSPAVNGSSDSALHHKNNCTRLLQDQLADPVLSKTHPVSATLLILLLYHLCDTGIANFKIHLAGVKRLMMMREVGKETGRWGWMETVFCWLDNMCSSINNREAQLRGGYLDMIHQSTDWGLESLVGCDRNLFMRLAGLPRINMLSQISPRPGSGDIHLVDYEDDGETEPTRNEDDGRTDFWLAWNAMKGDLYEWRPTTRNAATSSRFNSPNSERESSRTPPVISLPKFPQTPPIAHVRAHEAVEMNHWIHACNIYRYAAILYLDRLAYPHLPSSHSIFQNTVCEVLGHIGCIPSMGLGSRLLWPLFITGSECVVDAHKTLIRERCLDMQKDTGFFNKVSGLDVLERIWKEDDMDDACAKAGILFAGSRKIVRSENRSIGGRGLRWRKVIGEKEMEYLMV
ncbi:fungal-specific transcription factor domain-containing protein [Trichophaea hybrida]|nr:fungal-specific transcription factor domain-containing protein [Trichophaea hybrida]